MGYRQFAGFSGRALVDYGAEEQKRWHREQERIKNEAKQHRTRIRSLLKVQGIRPTVKAGGRGWKEYLESLKEGLPTNLWHELRRETQRLELAGGQIDALQGTRNKLVERHHESDEIFKKSFCY